MDAKQILGRKGYMLRLTLPIFLSYFMNMTVNTIDQMMVGNYSQTAVASIGNANQISSIMMMFFTVLNVASVILISQFKGAGDNRKEKVIYILALLCNGVASVFISVICLTLGRPIFTAMRVEQGAVLEGAVTYLSITGGTIVFQALVMAYTSFLKSNSMMTWPLVVTGTVNVVNILCNWLLIYGIGPFPEMGVAGAALATAISRALGAVMLAVIFRVKLGKLEWKLLRPFPFSDLKYMLKIGGPSAGESISYNISQLVIMIMINTMGLVAVNSKIFVQSVVTFSYMMSFAIGEATMVVTGYMLGNKQHDDANRRVMRSLITAVCVTLSVSTLLWIFSRPIISLFMAGSGDAEAMALREDILVLCKRIMLLEMLLEMGRSTSLVVIKALQAAGDVNFPVIITITFSWAIAVLMSYILGVVCGLGLTGVWIAMTIDECTRGIIFITRWRKGGWRKLDLVSAANAES